MAFLRQLLAFLRTGSVYAFAAGGSSACLGLLADNLGKNPYLWALFGRFLPLAPLTFWFSSDRAIRKRLERYKALADTKLIKPKEYDDLRQTLLRWYMSRQFGTPVPEPSKNDKATPPAPPGTPLP